ncbi:MAG TPA: hypothetical protein VKG79_13165 [Bryobacteraceae bacterium]|nr:hypothetical protein [Bryobacteraceae bacterium]
MTKFTRRELAAVVSTSAVLLAQPQAQPLPENPGDELKAVRAQLRETADQLDKFPLPMSTEPATTFKA